MSSSDAGSPTDLDEKARQLAELFREAEAIGELEPLILDLFTLSERKDLWERWRIVDLLLNGRSQRDIRDELKVSISKVTRGSLEIQKGTGAFRRVWERLRTKTS